MSQTENVESNQENINEKKKKQNTETTENVESNQENINEKKKKQNTETSEHDHSSGCGCGH